MASTKTVINFGAGPGKIPEEVLKEAQEEFLSYQNIGFSVTELSHRSVEYGRINQEAQDDLRELLNVPVSYKILFMHGGGQCLFSAIPLNLMQNEASADYITGGIWANVAANEARKFGKVNVIVPNFQDQSLTCGQKQWNLSSNASYLYYCDNDTIEGLEFPFIPESPNAPLIADMSSSIMTKKVDISKFGAIIAAVQKNLGTAGLGIVIIRDDLLGHSLNYCPSFLNFKTVSDMNSILNTPPIFSVYVLGKVLKWVKNHGGLEQFEKESKVKSSLLYNTIDNSHGFYKNNILAPYRSRINVTFTIQNGNLELENGFLKMAEERGMYQLKGHRLVGGIRVSLYNAITIENATNLVEFMKEFQEQYG